MHEDRFEKRVREKMDQLGFDPAEAVWSGVSKEINKGKKRRLPLLWLFLFTGLLLAGGGYYLTENVVNVQNVKNIQRVRNAENGKSIRVKENAKNGENILRKDAGKSIARGVGIVNGRIPSDDSKKENKKTYRRDIALLNERETNDHDKNFAKTTKGSRERNGNSATATANINKAISEEKIQDIASDNGGKLTNKDKNPVNDSANSGNLTGVDKNPVHDSATDKELTNNNKITRPAIDSATNKKTSLNKKQKKWEIGFAGHTGFSDIKQGSFVSGASTNNPANASPSPGTPAPAAGSPVSEIQSGFSFGMGIFANRNFSQRFSLSGGISYHYFSTHIQTGGSANSNAYSVYGPSALSGNYYLNGNGQSYTNSYDFLELPVSVDVRLNKRQNMPVVLEAGLSFAYLLNSDALFFDPYTNLYVKNTQSFNKAQLNATTALMFGFQLHQGKLGVGPQFQYGITGLTKQGYGASEHLLFYGMKISFVPRRK